MATTNTNSSDTPKNGKKYPTHNVQQIVEPEGDEKPRWPFVGAAWQNKDGSLNLVVNEELPKGARLHIRRRKARG